MSAAEEPNFCRVPGHPSEPVFRGDFSFNNGKPKQFSMADYGFFAAVLIFSAIIGGYHAWQMRKKIALDDFLLAGRSMSSFPVGLSLLASFMSAITLLGTPAEMYKYNTLYIWIGVSYFFVVAASAHIYHPVFYRLHVTSAYQYLEMRFSRTMRTTASCIFVVYMTFYMSFVLYAPSLALNAVTGISLWGSVLSVGVVCTIYTALGGMRAVLWTDTFQIFMMLMGLFIIQINAYLNVGSWEFVWESAKRTNRVDIDNFSLDPNLRHTVWGLLIGGYFTWISIYGVNQAQVQRTLSCRTLKEAKIAMWMNLPGLCLVLYLCSIIGLYVSAFYEKCDPLGAKLVDDSDQILPLFVMDVTGNIKGIPGIFVAALFSAALSTISSGLNSISAAILEDCVRNYHYFEISPAQSVRLSQCLSCVFGVLCLVLVYVASLMDNVLQAALTLYGIGAAPLCGVFSLGMFFPWATNKGAVCGLLGSVIVMGSISIGATLSPNPFNRPSAIMCINNCDPHLFDNATLKEFMDSANVTPVPMNQLPRSFFKMSYMWYSPIAFTSCIVIGLFVSFITGPRRPEFVHPDLIVPLFDVVFPFFLLPEKIKKYMRCGVPHESPPKAASKTTISVGRVRSSVPSLPSIFSDRTRASSQEPN